MLSLGNIDWSCLRCTLVNGSGNLTCTACGASRPRETRVTNRGVDGADSVDASDDMAATSMLMEGALAAATGDTPTAASDTAPAALATTGIPCGPCGLTFASVAALMAHFKTAAHKKLLLRLTQADDADDADDENKGDSMEGALSDEAAEVKADEMIIRAAALSATAGSAWQSFVSQASGGENGGPDGTIDDEDEDDEDYDEEDEDGDDGIADVDQGMGAGSTMAYLPAAPGGALSGAGAAGDGSGAAHFSPIAHELRIVGTESCAICQRLAEDHLRCRLCDAVYHDLCVLPQWKERMRNQEGCPKCFAADDADDDAQRAKSVEPCRCGSLTHRRTNSKYCPLNPRKLQQAATTAAAEQKLSHASSSATSGGQVGPRAEPGSLMDPEIAGKIVSVYRRLLHQVRQPGWEGAGIMTLSAAELAKFPFRAYLEHNRVAKDEELVRTQAKLTALESQLTETKAARLQLRKQVRQQARELLHADTAPTFLD